MEFTTATAKGDGQANEDLAVCGDGWAVLLDGATAPKGVDSGCKHDVPWLVRQLAAGVTLRLMTEPGMSLADILAYAIRDTCDAHADTCDLTNPDSPSSTVAIFRNLKDGAADCLVLGDSPVILRSGNEIMPVSDDRTAHLPGGRPYSLELVRTHRNQPGGFWIASTVPDAAYQAVSGEAPAVTDAALLSDGVTRLVEFYGWDWQRVFATLEHGGGAPALIAEVRDFENTSPPPGAAKRHDDATAVYCRVVSQPAVAVPDPYVMVR